VKFPFYRLSPLLFGALFLATIIAKLIHPGSATLALEVLGLHYEWAAGIVAGVTAMELYLGTILLLRHDLKYALQLSTATLLIFTAYLFFLSSLANPPSCGCLGLNGIFRSSREEAIWGLVRNCAMLWGLKWTYDCHFPRPADVGTNRLIRSDS